MRQYSRGELLPYYILFSGYRDYTCRCQMCVARTRPMNDEGAYDVLCLYMDLYSNRIRRVRDPAFERPKT